MTTENEAPEIDETDDDESAPVETPEPPADPNEPIEVVTEEAQRESRKQRRAQRQSEFRQAQDDAQRHRREAEDLRAQLSRQQQSQPQQQQLHPAVHELRQIDEATARLHREYSAVASQPGFTPQQQEQYEQRARELQTARMASVARAAAPQVDVQELARKIQWQQFTTEHADVFNHPQAYQWGVGEYYKRIADGHADTKAMAEDLLDAARRRFGLKPRNGNVSKPDAATRQRFSGVPARGAGSATAANGTVHMSKDDKRMARIAFGDKMSEKEAYQHWANTVGKKRAALEK
jgi:hypothetical protein